MTFIGYIIHFFISGFPQFYYASNGFRQDGMSLAFFIIPLVGGVYFLGWPSLATYFFGLMAGGFVFVNSRKEDRVATPFELASGIASAIHGFVLSGGTLTNTTKVFLHESNIAVGETAIIKPLSEVRMSDVNGFSELQESITSGIFVRESIDMYAASFVKYLSDK